MDLDRSHGKAAPAQAFRPGEYIEAEMDARGWAPPQVAALMGIEQPVLFRLLWGWGRINDDIAERLAWAFAGTSTETWLGLQRAWDGRRI